jgi:hypothetical protein
MDVDAYMEKLQHARKGEIVSIRAAILASDPELSESIKWNAPNFVFNGEDRITFRLHPRDRVELILHRGAKKRSDTDSFVFTDASGLINWATQDRGVIEFPEDSRLDSMLEICLPVLHAWVRS